MKSIRPSQPEVQGLRENMREETSASKFEKKGLSIVKVMNSSELIIDQPNGICILRWKGRVDIETASELLTLGSAAVLLNGYDKLLIDRRGLIEFDNEARIWIDGWIKTKAKVVAKCVDKLAIINSQSVFGNFFNNAFNATIAQAMPHMELKKFDHGGKARSWLLTS